MPEVGEEWDILNGDKKSKLTRMIDLFCGLHYIVELSDQALETLKVWDKLYDDAMVGSLKQSGYSKGKRGTLRLLRTVCRLFRLKGVSAQEELYPLQIMLVIKASSPSPLLHFYEND